MAWRRPGDKPLSESRMESLLTLICVTRPQWVNWYRGFNGTGPLVISYLTQIVQNNVRHPLYTYFRSIAVTSWWARWRHKSPASRLLALTFVQALIKYKTKAPHHWLLCKESTGDRLCHPFSLRHSPCGVWDRGWATCFLYGGIFFEKNKTFHKQLACLFCMD